MILELQTRRLDRNSRMLEGIRQPTTDAEDVKPRGKAVASHDNLEVLGVIFEGKAS